MRRPYLPTLTELQALVATAEAGAVTGGAETLGLTQSAVSKSLTSLETRLGAALFHRVRRRLVLSDAGRAFLPEAQRLLAELDRAALAVMSFGGHREVLRIACLPTFAQGWLIPRLARLARTAPGIIVDLSATLGPLNFDRDPRDAMILRGPAPAGLQAAVLAEEWLVAVAAPAALADVADPLADLPLLQQATRPDLWLDWFRATVRDPVSTLRGPRFEQFGMVLAAARAGMGVALVPELLVAGDLAAGHLVRVADRRMAGAAPYLLIWPDRSANLPAFATFRQAMQDQGTT